jgi:hypothetical protein
VVACRVACVPPLWLVALLARGRATHAPAQTAFVGVCAAGVAPDAVLRMLGCACVCAHAQIIFGAVGGVRARDERFDAWYLRLDLSSDVWYRQLVVPARFLLLNSTMIPISLKVRGALKWDRSGGRGVAGAVGVRACPVFARVCRVCVRACVSDLGARGRVC